MTGSMTASRTPASLVKELGFSSVRVEVDADLEFAYGPQDRPRLVSSIRKSIMGLLLDELITEERLDLSTTLAELSISDPELRWPAELVTVENLVSSTAGNTVLGDPSGRELLTLAGLDHLADVQPNAPGEVWRYSNWDFNVLGAVYAEASGRSVFDGVDRLVSRVGLTDWVRERDATWAYGPDAFGATQQFPNYRMSWSARDLARIGHACLTSLDGDGPFSQSWLSASITADLRRTGAPAPRDLYGYLWWTSGLTADTNSFCAWGSGGQYLLVYPNQRAVVVLLRPLPKTGPWEPANDKLLLLLDRLLGQA